MVVVCFGGLFALELGVVGPELVGVTDLETGVGGLSFCARGKKGQKVVMNTRVGGSAS